MNQRIFSGYGAHKNILSLLSEFRINKLFLVTGKRSYYISQAATILSDALSKFDYIRFYDFETNPKLEDIKRGIELFNSERCDFIVGMGGGSVLDIAKAISLLATQVNSLEERIVGKKEIGDREIPSLMIPTTAGTGSESTHFSVIYINKTKYSLAHPSLLPDMAILDPIFTEGLSPYITACSGMDALCQGIESFWSINATEESKEYSRQAIQLSLSNIVKAVNNPDKESRENMLLAGNYAGKAINISKTTAAHALSYPFTSFFNIPHGHAVALTLPAFISLNNDITNDNLQDRRGLTYVKNTMKALIDIMGATTCKEAENKIITIMKKIKLETRLSPLGLGIKDLDVIVKNGFNPERIINNPRKIQEKEVRCLLEGIL